MKREERTECHGHEGHHASEGHLRLVVVVGIVTICPQAVLLVVVCVAWHTLVGVDLLDVSLAALVVMHVVRCVYNDVSMVFVTLLLFVWSYAYLGCSAHS